jgi:hypothetical protein
MKRRVQGVEESYRRDAELFRTEVMKRDAEVEEEREK